MKQELKKGWQHRHNLKHSWLVTCSIIGLLKLPILVLQLCQRLPASGTVGVGVYALLQTLQHTEVITVDSK